MKSQSIKIISENRKARFNYFLSDFLECGISLQGTEIKSLRTKGCSLSDSYIVIRNGEAFILNMHIPVYDQGTIFNHEPLRTRKLLLHKSQIYKFEKEIKTGGFTVVPTKVYFSNGKAKVEIALAKGKHNYDKRETIKERDLQRDLAKNNGY